MDGTSESLVPAIVLDDDWFDRELEYYYALHYRVLKDPHHGSQPELDIWIEEVQPKLKAYAQAHHMDYDAECARVSSSIRRV